MTDDKYAQPGDRLLEHYAAIHARRERVDLPSARAIVDCYPGAQGLLGRSDRPAAYERALVTAGIATEAEAQRASDAIDAEFTEITGSVGTEDDGPRTVDLVAHLAALEARMGAIGEEAAKIRTALTARMVAQYQRDGMAPTGRAPGLGTVSLTLPKDRIMVTREGRAEFDSWVAERYPVETLATVKVDAGDADRVVEVLEAAGVTHRGVEVQMHPAREKAITESAVLTDSGEIITPAGEVIPGVAHIPAPEPTRISVRLNPEAKARAAAELADPAVLEVLTRPLGSPLAAAAPEPVQPAEDVPDDATGVPVYDDGVVPYAQRKRAELVEECRTRGLPVSGTIPKLAERLLADDVERATAALFADSEA